MQQTEKYKLNLIERTDTFSPEALNENTQKVESALAAHEAAVGEVTDGLLGQSANLDSRVTALEAHRLVVGSYTGTGREMSFDLGFTPKLVFVRHSDYQNTLSGLAIQGMEGTSFITIVENGFKMGFSFGGSSLTMKNEYFLYFALV